MARPKLTVLMPNYNHGAFIAEALESVAGQTVPPDRIIVADDASTDDSLAVLGRLKGRIPRLEVIVNERNRGVVATCQDLLVRADTECVYMMGADDKILPTFFQSSLALLAQNPAAGMCVSLSRLIDGEGRDLGVYRTPIVRRVPCYLSPAEVKQTLISEGWFAQGNATIYRRDALLSAGLNDELGSFVDGFAAHVIALTRGACFVPRPLAAWRRLEDGYSATQAGDPQRFAAIRERAVKLMSTEYAGLFPPAYVDRFDKEMRLQSELLRVEARRERRQAWLASAGAAGRAVGAVLALAAPLEHGARVLWLRHRLGLALLDPFRKHTRRLIRRPIA
jgi:glycosyltransferase involved in cell wall biosynthesis